MSNPTPLHEALDRIRTNALKDAHKLYAERVEAGMNEMVQLAQQRGSLLAQADEAAKPEAQ